jgi:putative hydrolases of HD superfamily
MNPKKICDYIFELGTLKKFQHSGTKLAGVKNPDTIAEHVYRAAIIGYILAKMENADPAKTALILLFHDNAECRITDLHKVARRYIKTKDAEMDAYKEQIFGLPEDIKEEFMELFTEFENAETKEGMIAREADMLETAFQAKEYLDLGHKACQDWLDTIGKCIKTAGAKKIFATLSRTNFTDWWRGLKFTDKY